MQTESRFELSSKAEAPQPAAQEVQIQQPTQRETAVAVARNKNDIGSFLEKYKGEISRALPKHLTPDKILRIALTEIRRNPKLLACNKISLIAAIIQSAQLGLIPDSLTGQAYLIPYKDQCQFQIGYKGMMRLVYNTGGIINITAQVVYSGDTFEFEYGLNPTLKHIPDRNGGRKDTDIIWVYAIAYLKNGGNAFTVLTLNDVLWHKSFSKMKTPTGAWVTAFPEMAKETAIRVLCKYLPASSEDMTMQTAIALDEQADKGEQNNGGNIFEGEFFDTEQTDEQKNYANEVVDKITGEVR